MVNKFNKNIKESLDINDGSKLWNVAPDEVTKSSSLWSAKKAIKAFVRTLPI